MKKIAIFVVLIYSIDYMKFIRFFLLTIAIISCTSSTKDRDGLIDFVPDNVSLVVKVSNFESFKSSLDNNDFFKQLSKESSYKTVANPLNNLKFLKPKGEILICFSEIKDTIHYSVITTYTNDLFSLTDSVSDYSSRKLDKETKNDIVEHRLRGKMFYSTVVDSVFFASSSKQITKHVFSTIHTNTNLKRLYRTANNDKTVSIFMNTKRGAIKTLFVNDSIQHEKFTDIIALDVDINPNQILFNGVTKATDSTKSLVNIFKGNVPQVNQIQNVTPSNSDGFLSFTFSDFNALQNNLLAYNKTDSIIDVSIFGSINEVGVIYQDQDRAVVLNAMDNIAVEDGLIGSLNVSETFRQVDIYNFNRPELFKQTFYPFIIFDKANKYCVLDQFFVFSNNTELLQSIITNYQNKTTLEATKSFVKAKEQLSDASSILSVGSSSLLKQIISKNIDSLSLDLRLYNTSALQFIYDTDFAHINGIVEKSRLRVSKSSITEELNIKLDNDLLNAPQLIVNHRTKQKEIVVQDVKNNLYLISNKGKILWKKRLNGSVLGNINQMDIYKNGRLQLVFATPHYIYVIDRNGNDVKPFPKKFNDEITQPLAVFDYDKNKNYRFLLTQGKQVFMYDKMGKTVKGFTFKATADNIVNIPEHFRIAGKDYIVLKTKSKIYILNRQGHIRVKPKLGARYSTNPVFNYNNTFTTSTSTGNLVSIATTGHVNTQNLNLSESHTIAASNKTLVTLSNNKLSIKGKTIELDYGNYSEPKLFYINNKIYVSVTDLQTQKVYLFDSQTQSIPNFPVYGTSSIILDNIDKDSNLEFVTKGENNSILLYKMN
ncbi:MAG: ribonuclease HII [Aestuariibaculum sp.]